MNTLRSSGIQTRGTPPLAMARSLGFTERRREFIDSLPTILLRREEHLAR